MKISKSIKKAAASLLDMFLDRSDVAAPFLSSSAEAFLALAMRDAFQCSTVMVMDGANTQETVHQDIHTLCGAAGGSDLGERSILFYPALDAFVTDRLSMDMDVVGQRSLVMRELLSFSGNSEAWLKAHGGYAPIIVTSIQGLMQKTISPNLLRKEMCVVSVGDNCDVKDVVDRFLELGCDFVVEVEKKGQASLRGGILDVWPATEAWPVRIEFFGNIVESIRFFDPATQRSIEKLTSIEVFSVGNAVLGNKRGRGSFFSYLKGDTSFVWCDMAAIASNGNAYWGALRESASTDGAVSLKRCQSLVKKLPGLRQLLIGGVLGGDVHENLAIEPIRKIWEVRREVFQPDLLEKSRDELWKDLSDRSLGGQSVVMFFDTLGAKDHFADRRLIEKKIVIELGVLSEGFIWEALGLVIVAESDLYGRQKRLGRRYDPTTRTGAKPKLGIGARVADLADIEPGDLVVHIEYGVGEYCGIFEISVAGVFQEVLAIQYADKAKLYVPVLQSHLLTKYVGTSRKHARLHRLGGKRWMKEKCDAERSLHDLAASLLKTQAERETLSGFSFPSDNLWQHEFDASFPYRETMDQLNAIQAIKEDMESTRPMDRLVCGDAGYGKTEVAVRAVFKTVMAGKQVAVLVPTTVLAQQHYESFRSRMAAYPVRIDVLSRFRSLGERSKTRCGLADGTIDVVIGTHALLQEGVRFRDLGLVVIDEEQRFGVKHKEWLKNRKQLVDVLTLTATPIPRTLYMGLSGTRDMSLIQTPPSERTAIQTIVTSNTDEVVREGILRELGREGQVFYLHNRVMTINRVKLRLESLVPEARIAVAHGQMGATALSVVMKEFIAGKYDVLLCTTIIESGVDIPRANTIFIDRADRFGIADLYQLRGRVGRSSCRAYAYLIIPLEGTLSGDASSRIKALSKYSSLSAGFNLALRDLEIRGAGNMLGSMQSGHIAAVGFGLYCQLLSRTVAAMKGEKQAPIIDVRTSLDFVSLAARDENIDSAAVIPRGYIESESLRVELYRKIAGVVFLDEISQLKKDIIDRFGPMPIPVGSLLKIAELRIVCAEKKITTAETRDKKVIFMRGQEYLKRGHRFPRLTGVTVPEQLDELVEFARTVDAWDEAGGMRRSER